MPCVGERLHDPARDTQHNIPAVIVPETTVPIPVIMKDSSICSWAGLLSFFSQCGRVGSRFRKVCSIARPSPETFDTRKIGTDLLWTTFFAATTTSSIDCTMVGILRPAPLDLRILEMVAIVSSSTCGGAISILVTTTKAGSARLTAMPRCSLVMRVTPMLPPSSSMQ